MNSRKAWLIGIICTAISASAQFLVLMPFRHTAVVDSEDAIIVAAAMGSSLWATLALGWGLWAFIRIHKDIELRKLEAVLWWAIGVVPALLGGAVCLVLVLAWLS